MSQQTPSVGVVVIGRNEGERLRTCLQALLRAELPVARIVYVDSGSSDGSVDIAAGLGIHAIALSPPFTAAKGRNAGMAWLLAQADAPFAIQFVDGDCEYFPSWFEVAARTLRDDDSIAAVNGILTERHPEATIWNLLC
ncbi:MAG TPA: glycosyltransferase family A protein, partial [Myxococcota bacterium]